MLSSDWISDVCSSDFVFMSLQQTGPFKSDDKGTMLRGVAMAYEGPTYFVTLGDSGIETLEDLEGKKVALGPPGSGTVRSEEHTSELQSLMRTSYAVFCLKNKKKQTILAFQLKIT